MLNNRFIILFVISLFYSLFAQNIKPKICFTFDDTYPRSNYLFDSDSGNSLVLNTLDYYHLKAAYFVKADIVSNEKGNQIVREWNERGHMICNHSYSHLNYHSDDVTFEQYSSDFLKADSMLSGYSGFTRLYRYPMLREGNSTAKRDSMRNLLYQHGYRIGYVTIDNTEWLINSRLRDRLKKEESIDINACKNIYVDHLFSLALQFDSLATELTGRKIPHIMLLHNNTTSALFLKDLIQKFIDEGWEISDAGKAFSDPIYSHMPDVIWQRGQSLLFSIACEKELLKEGETFNLRMEEILIEALDRIGL